MITQRIVRIVQPRLYCTTMYVVYVQLLHVHVGDTTSLSGVKLVIYFIGKIWRGHCKFQFAFYRAMAGRGAISLAEKNTRLSTLTHTSGFGEECRRKREEYKSKISVRDLRARFERENTWRFEACFKCH